MNKHAQALGKLGGSKKSKRKTEASRLNGKKGGRPVVRIDCPTHGLTKVKKLSNRIICRKCYDLTDE